MTPPTSTPILRSYAIGQMANNTYLVADPASNHAVLIDPAMGIGKLLPGITSEGWQIQMILLTHAHFDHTYGIYELMEVLEPLPPIALHPRDGSLYNGGGLGELMGLFRDPFPAVQHPLTDGESLPVGQYTLTAHHCPGHTPGHVFFYSRELEAAFVGDIIFRRSIGRTDLPGGSQPVLLQSIREHILTLPPQTRLLNGHGAETTVAEEAAENPFLFG
ncbi:MAG: MBL fold metallo-hydrolase [Anaerolineae bacterium]|nr:MBL fold metallo-hydrolase [Anaerolineae bacterium]